MRISDWSSDVCFSDLGLGLHGYTLQGFTDVLTSPGKEFRSQAGNISVAGDASRVAAGVALSASIEAAQVGGGWSGSIHTAALLKPGRFLVLSTPAGSDRNMRLVVAQAHLPAGTSCTHAGRRDRACLDVWVGRPPALKIAT